MNLRWTLVVAAGLLALACSGSGNNNRPPDGGKMDGPATGKKDSKPGGKQDSWTGGKKKEVGQPCSANVECKEGRCHLGVCIASQLKGVGAPCTGKAHCKTMKCVGGKCAPGASPKGAACLNKEECASGKCEAGKCAGTSTGGTCANDAQCPGGVCYQGKCAKNCTKPSDCPTGQVCNSDNGKRVFCSKAAFNPQVGKFCGISASCPGGLTCTGTKYDWATYCRGTCKSDLECPPAYECETSAGAGSPRYCRPRRFCSTCAHDGSCPTGHKCVAMLGGKYCARKCNPGSTECPMAASCKAVAGGHYCQPKGGSCKGNGGVCSYCTKNDHCNPGGLCLAFNLTEEPFCGSDCTSSGSCGGGHKCYTIGSSGKKQCGPALKPGGKYPTCSSGITYPIFNVGDVIDDFAMVGYRDANNNGTLADDKNLQVVKLSDLAKGGAKLLLLNISAFW